MIQLAADGLSHGIWMMALQGPAATHCLTQAVFACLPLEPCLVQEYVNLLRAMSHQACHILEIPVIYLHMTPL